MIKRDGWTVPFNNKEDMVAAIIQLTTCHDHWIDVRPLSAPGQMYCLEGLSDLAVDCLRNTGFLDGVS